MTGIKSRRISRAEAEELMSPLQRDLHSVYIISQESVLDILHRAETEPGWTDEKILEEIKNLFGD